MDPVGSMLVVISGLILLGVAGEFIFGKTGIPDPIWLVGAGVLLGPVFNVVSADMLRPAVPFFGAIALTVILAGGAYRLQLREVAAAAPRALLLGVVGFAFSMLGMVAFFWVGIRTGWLAATPPMYWLMVGGIVGGTSALVVMPSVAGGRVDSRAARTLEVESSATDALCVVVTMALIDLIVRGATEFVDPIVTLLRQIGIGVGAGVAWSILMMPFYPALNGRTHGYILLIAAMFLLYAITNGAEGNGAMAVLVSALLLGNGAIVVPRLIPGARPEAFIPSEQGRVTQHQLTFLIKSFFFVLIGLMFPADTRSIVLGVIGALVLLVFRLPAVAVSVRGQNFSRKQTALLMVSIPRGLAAGVLSTLPMESHIPGTERLSGAVFALIVATILLFALGVALVSRLPDQARAAVDS